MSLAAAGRFRRVLCQRTLLRALPPATCLWGLGYHLIALPHALEIIGIGVFSQGCFQQESGISTRISLADLTAVEQDNMVIREVVMPALGGREAGVACPDNGNVSVDL